MEIIKQHLLKASFGLLASIITTGGIYFASNSIPDKNISPIVESSSEGEVKSAQTQTIEETPTPTPAESVNSLQPNKNTPTPTKTSSPTTKPSSQVDSPSPVSTNDEQTTVNSISTPIPTQQVNVSPSPTSTPVPLLFCISPSSASRKFINFNEEIEFDGSCTQGLADSSIKNIFWNFREGTLENPVYKEGTKVSHRFTTFAKNFQSADCKESYNRGFEVEFCVEKTSRGGGCTVHHYCPSGNDPFVQNLKSCIANSNGSKNPDICIGELGL
jgi:hypothetical protein